MEKACVIDNERCLKKLESATNVDLKCDHQRQVTSNESLDSEIADVKEPRVSSCENEVDRHKYIVDASSRTTYLKGKFLGKGGFARVHQLLDLAANITYAGKIIPKTQITKRQHMEKIAREILIHRGLIHKNVVRLHHFFEDSVNAYIILENCSRKSLVHVLRNRKVVTEPEVRYYLKQLVAGVQYIHSQKVIHRDLKPGNMLLTENMIVKVGDFGLATQVDSDSRVTICGTPNYIAPEVLNKLSYSFEADVWAIGCIMYALLVGQPPFETATLKETYARIVSNQYTLPELASAHARSLLNQLLSPNPEDRPSLNGILDSFFFRLGYLPSTLSPTCCFTKPVFPAYTLDVVNSCSRQATASLANVIDFEPATSLTVVSSLIENSPLVSIPDRSIMQVLKQSKLPAPFTSSTVYPNRPQVSLKKKLSSVLCADKLVMCHNNNNKKISNASLLYQNLVGCFSTMPKSRNLPNPMVVECTPLFVSKWIDYSNKYGFGFQLSDRSVGVLFNDNTRMAFTPDRSRVEFHDVNGKVTAHPQHSVPVPLAERLALLRYFGEYMDEHLTEGGDVGTKSSRHKSPVPHMKRWVRTNTAIIMELCSGTLQINFFKDHTKVIICMCKSGYLVTYINSDRQSRSYTLNSIANNGCDSFIAERLRFAAAVLREFADLEGERVS